MCIAVSLQRFDRHVQTSVWQIFGWHCQHFQCCLLFYKTSKHSKAKTANQKGLHLVLWLTMVDVEITHYVLTGPKAAAAAYRPNNNHHEP